MATGGDDKAGSSKACQPYTPAGRWFFTKTELSETPSVKAGLPMTKEISYRQQAANFIQDMGQHLRVTQLCINTAIVYCQRFYMFHSFHRFHRNSIALAALFLAAKVEEQPRKLEHVIKMAHLCLNGRDAPPLDIRADAYQEKAQELVTNENILLQTLGFDVAIDHPHTHVVRCCQLVKASKELAQASYYLATNSLHLTTMCLRYSPTIVACFCIHLACKWSNYKIPLSAQNKEWFVYVDPTATLDLLEEMTVEFLTIYDQCPSRLKKKIKASTQAAREEEEQKQSGNPPLNANHFNGPPSQIQAPTAMPGQVTANSRPAENEQPRRVSNHQPRPSSHHPNVNQPMKIPHVPSTTMSNTHLPPANAYNAEKVAHGLHPPMPPSSLNLSHQKLPHDQLSKHQNWPHGSSHQKGMPVVPNQIQDPKSHSQHQQSQSRQQSSSSSSSRSNHSNSIPSSQTSRSGGNSSGMTQQKVSSHGQVPPGQHHSHHQQPPIHHSRSQSSTKVSSHVEMVGQPKLVPTQSLPAARQRTPPLKLPVTTERSIFDIDSPVKSINDPISTLPPVKSFFDSPKMEPPVRSMSYDTVPVKIETKDSLSSFGSLGSLPPKVSKRPSLFSPPSDSESKSSAVPIPPVVMPSNAYANSTNTFIKQEEEQKPVVHNSASEHRVQSQPVKVEQIKTEAIKIEKQSHEEEERREKKHKEKKKKKNKDKDKDRDERHGGESTSSSSKKHKHKHKEKSKDRGDSDREKIPSSSSATPPVAVGGIKLKIKTLPPVAPEASQPPLAPLKISLAHVNGESDSHSRKRSRDESGSGIGPASKMSRVLGTSVEKEREFLHVVGGSGSSGHHLSSKSSKKVSSR